MIIVGTRKGHGDLYEHLRNRGSIFMPPELRLEFKAYNHSIGGIHPDLIIVDDKHELESSTEKEKKTSRNRKDEGRVCKGNALAKLRKSLKISRYDCPKSTRGKRYNESPFQSKRIHKKKRFKR